jgi:hypothetical protein
LGILAEARIANSLEPLGSLRVGGLGLLGVQRTEPVAA